jgi:hypothetical protein
MQIDGNIVALNDVHKTLNVNIVTKKCCSSGVGRPTASWSRCALGRIDAVLVEGAGNEVKSDT